jgi:hypothetical protein
LALALTDATFGERFGVEDSATIEFEVIVFTAVRYQTINVEDLAAKF